MTGHHIYTRSWYELGAKSRNAGTFTVELTDGVFGANTDEVIYNRLNPMCAAVPEALAPLNTGQSLLRIFHPLPNTTVVTRSWFVADKITNRGPVAYAFSLIFRDNGNAAFLKHPAAAFSPKAAESYDSFCSRVTPDAPVTPSTKFDPKKEDYSSPYIYPKEDWRRSFKFERELFVDYYVALCKAICGKENAKVGVVLPSGMNYSTADGELLMLTTLSILPTFMKKKFGAASNWKGLMDGSSSKAINGLHLICCYGEHPISDTKLPVVDLTGAGEHENLEVAERHYAGWVWDNIDNPDELMRFEQFMSENFESVVDRMPYPVIDTCFLLWNTFVNLKKTIDFSIATIVTRLITESFARNYAKFPFICDRIKECLGVIHNTISANPHADLKIELVQAVCTLANNSEPNAQRIVHEIHAHIYEGSEWKKVAVTVAYYAGLLDRPNIAPDLESRCCAALLACLNSADANGASVAQNAIAKYCMRLRAAMLGGDVDKADKAFSEYHDDSLALYSATGGKLADSFFQLPPRGSAVSEDTANMFIKMAKFDVESLEYVPSPARWSDTLRWIEPIMKNYLKNTDLVKSLFEPYYKCIPPGRLREYILQIEKSNREILKFLMYVDEKIENEIENEYVKSFSEEFGETERKLDSDETWGFISGWLDRLEKLSFPIESRIFSVIRQAAPIDRNALPAISRSLSADSFKVIVRLYGRTDQQLNVPLRVISVIDEASATKTVSEEMIRNAIRQNGLEIQEYNNRLDFWYEKGGFDDIVSWALTVFAAIVRSPDQNMNSINEYINVFVSLCRSKGSAKNTSEGLACIFTALKKLDACLFYNRDEIKETFKNWILDALRTDQLNKALLSDEAREAFSKLDMFKWKTTVGRQIAEHLLLVFRDINPDILDSYYIFQRVQEEPANEDAKRMTRTAAVIALVFTIAALCFTFVLGSGQIAAAVPKALFIASAVIGALVFCSMVLAVVKHRSK